MSDDYRVDLDELADVVTQLKRLQGRLDAPVTKVTYGTSLPKSALGTNFGEAETLFAAHEEMQTYMADTVKKLQEFIRVFGEKTEMSKNAYENVEYETKNSMRLG